MTIVLKPHKGVLRLRESEPAGTVRTVRGRNWTLEHGRFGHRWRAEDCMCTIGLSPADTPDYPYAVFHIRYKEFEVAARFAVRKHNQIVKDAKKVLAKWPSTIRQTGEEK